MTTARTGLFVAEGSSDEPLAGIVENLFFDRGVELVLSRPDLGLLVERVRKDVGSQVRAGIQLLAGPPDVVVVHRDADAAGATTRHNEIVEAMALSGCRAPSVAIVPVRMTEAWLLMSEYEIRVVAGNPNGRVPLNLPKHQEVKGIADPKSALKEAILTAAQATGRRRDRLARRFDESRRQLLSGLDPTGPVARLAGWQSLISHVDTVAAGWS